ncbi:glycerophosphodiester phosphodiesterase 1-like isoform X2 [Tachypleus tridentatus]|uniref:glycerophosphodiester phosphodiesterase 1-like isoform X2 n=1 Tax=Tachypleus tridentatus TaxID=6853 RepID=UPI003FD40F4E
MASNIVPPCGVTCACIQVWFVIFCFFIFQYFLMGSFYFSVIVLLLLNIVLYYVVIPPVENQTVLEVLGLSADRSDKHPPVYAHRGGGYDAPENTLAAFRKAKDNGATGVEFDISFTKDGIAILLNDETVDRTTNGSGYIGNMTFHEVRELSASKYHPHSSLYKGEKIPTLEEGIREGLKLNLRMILDVKESDNKALTAVLGIFEKHHELYKVAMVASFSPFYIYQLRKTNPSIICGLIWRPKFVSHDDLVKGRPRFRGPWKMTLAKIGDCLLDWSFHSWLWEYLRMWSARGVQVIPWTINHPVEKEHFSSILNLPIMTDSLQIKFENVVKL